jgi:hypothetical protein
MKMSSLVRAAIRTAVLVWALPVAIVMTAPTAQAQPRPEQCSHSQPVCPRHMKLACTEPGQCLDRAGRPVQGCRRYGCVNYPGGADDADAQPTGGWPRTRPPLCATLPKCGFRRVAVCTERATCSVIGAGRPSGCRQYACILRL